ncbi:unnamed protein product [Arctia plantaginis]|uniref:Uncharacterized protein n=1 Tax=Arctia plantaginis TaxID=874455 RepID=A0A8S1BG17_ARCPL|nr:unnamed protein product [Arctia plantaginis]
MFKFGKFKSTFDVYSATKGGHQERVSDGISSVTGAYRLSRNEFSMPGKYSETQEKVNVAAPVQPKIPPQQILVSSRQPKSSKEGVTNKLPPPPIPPTQSGVVLNPQGPSEPGSALSERVRAVSEPSIKEASGPSSKGPTANPNNSQRQLDAYKRVEKKRLEEQKKLEKKRLEEQKKLEKKRLEEQKKSQKLALQEQAKQEKLRKEREKKEAQQLKKDKKNKKQAPQRPLANPMAQGSSQAPSNPPAQSSADPRSTNTLNSSISKTSGPPPYSEVPQPERKENETNSNVQFRKPVEADSWDLVAQHRHNVSTGKNANPTQPVKGQTTMDLNFSLGEGKSNA